MCLLPAAVSTRLTEDPDYCYAAGSVTSADAGLVLGTLADLAARAVAHEQKDLALALSQAIRRLDDLSVPSAEIRSA